MHGIIIYYVYLEKIVGFMAVTMKVTVYRMVTRCILVDMHAAYGAACCSETAVNLIAESGNIHSSNLCKKEGKDRV